MKTTAERLGGSMEKRCKDGAHWAHGAGADWARECAIHQVPHGVVPSGILWLRHYYGCKRWEAVPPEIRWTTIFGMPVTYVVT